MQSEEFLFELRWLGWKDLSVEGNSTYEHNFEPLT